MAEKSNSAAGGGIGFCGLLTIVLITLKLTGFIDWSWVWVLAPLWAPTLMAVGVFLAVLLGAAIVLLACYLYDKTQSRK